MWRTSNSGFKSSSPELCPFNQVIFLSFCLDSRSASLLPSALPSMFVYFWFCLCSNIWMYFIKNVIYKSRLSAYRDRNWKVNYWFIMKEQSLSSDWSDHQWCVDLWQPNDEWGEWSTTQQSADCKVAELICVVHVEKTQSKLCLPGRTEILGWVTALEASFWTLLVVLWIKLLNPFEH